MESQERRPLFVAKQQPQQQHPYEYETVLSFWTLHKHTIFIIILCICSFANAYLMLSIFPYAGYMAVHLLAPDKATTENAGIYAGMIASSFMLGRFCTCYHWGVCSDTLGRKTSLVASLLLSMVFSLLFGTSKSLSSALIWRTCLGMSNGMDCKSMAMEISRGNDTLERRALGLVVGMRSWGMLIGPALGGFLSEPLQQYPALKSWLEQQQQDAGLVGFLSKYPFFLPNAVGALLCLIGALAVLFIMEETLPNAKSIGHFLCRRHGVQEQRTAITTVYTEHCEENMLDEELKESTTTADTTPVWTRPRMQSHLMVYWLFSLIMTYIDEAFPLYCISKQAGLGLLEASIGQVMSGAGLVFAVFQYPSFAVITGRFGIYPSLSIACLLGTIPTVLIPLVPAGAKASSSSSYSWLSFIALGLLLGCLKLMHSLFLISCSLAINKLVDAEHRGRTNALVLLGNSVVKAIGPMVTGLFVALCFSTIPGTASIYIWCVVPPLTGILLDRVLVRRLARNYDGILIDT